jgi:hypothetical protein
MNLCESVAFEYHPLVDEILREIIKEARGLGPACSFQRNPSLSRLSAQLFFIAHIKTNVNDRTISFSGLKVRGPNADSRYIMNA